MPAYIPWIRSKVGSAPIFLNVAVIVIFDEQGRILLQKRSATQELWGFPGGIIELGESAAQAALREAREETGLEIEIQELLGVYTQYQHQFENGDQAQPIAIVFTGRVTGGEIKVDGHETFDLVFFDPHQAPALFNLQNNDILADVRARRRGVYR